jgi:uncharacterized membrane protein YeiH
MGKLPDWWGALSTAQLAIEIVATLAFALSGLVEAARKRLDAVGVCVVAALTAFGGGTLRDVLIRQIPSVLSSGLYAVPALVGAAALVVVTRLGVYGLATAVGAAALCFVIRMVGVHFDLNAPMPPAPPGAGPDDG